MKIFQLYTACVYFFFTLAHCEDLSYYESLKERLSAEIAAGKIDYLPLYSEPLSKPVKNQKDFFKLLVLDNEVDLVKGLIAHAYRLLFSKYYNSESIFTFALKEDKLEMFKILIEAVKPEHHEFIDVEFIKPDSLMPTAIRLKRLEYVDFLLSKEIFSIDDVEAALNHFENIDEPASFIASKFDYELVNIDDLIEIQTEKEIEKGKVESKSPEEKQETGNESIVSDSKIYVKSLNEKRIIAKRIRESLCNQDMPDILKCNHTGNQVYKRMELPMVNYYRYLSLFPLWNYEFRNKVVVDLSVPGMADFKNTVWFQVQLILHHPYHHRCAQAHRAYLGDDRRVDFENYLKLYAKPEVNIFASCVFRAIVGSRFRHFYPVFKKVFTNLRAKDLIYLRTQKQSIGVALPFNLDVTEALLRDFPDSRHILLRLFFSNCHKFRDEQLMPYIHVFFKYINRNDPKIKYILKLVISLIFYLERFNVIYEMISAGYVPLDLTIRHNLNIAQLLVSFQAKDVVLKLEKSDLKEEFRKALLIDYGFNADALRTSICSNSKFSPVVLKLLIDLVPEELTRLDIKEETIEQTCHNNSNIYKHLVGQKKKRGLQVFSARSYKERNHFLERTFPNIKRPNTPKGTQKQKILSYGSFNFERNVALENGQIVDHLYQLIKEGKEDLVKYYKTIYTNRSLLSPKIPKSYLSLAVEHGNLNIVKSLIEIHEMEDFFSFFLSSKELPNHLVYQIIELKRIEILNYLMDRGVIKEEILFACLQTFKDRQKVDEFLKEVQSVALSLLEYMSSVESELFFDKMSSILLDTLNSKKLLLPVEPQLVIEDSKEELDLNDPTVLLKNIIEHSPESFHEEYKRLTEKLNPHLFFYIDKRENDKSIVRSILEPLFYRRDNHRMTILEEILKDYPEIFYTEVVFFQIVYSNDPQLLKFVLENTKDFHIYLQNLYIEDSNQKQSYFEKVLSANPELVSVLVNSGAFPLSFRLNSSFNVAQRILVSDVYNSLREYNQDEVREALTHVSLGMNFSLKMYFEAARENYDEEFVKYLMDLERTSLIRKDYNGKDIFAYCQKNFFVKKETVNFMAEMKKEYFVEVVQNSSYLIRTLNSSQ
ncbi:hypothetical protein ROZALSC1DRAFT_24332 [Rozella allomycis CSF55]|uniref:Uncharacterized protein n=1 Tax=Rozella allomycis (strain CSF55) TaxID=988480 RepID=A0A4V1IZ98_ROZAC|nr:hypothetical protein ROZALSC1DRAFT_24332 [Rozella allomycis CSF55]